ncbi:MAG: hypothetical protein AB1898_27245 [Acidobacteriota bacterium]
MDRLAGFRSDPERCCIPMGIPWLYAMVVVLALSACQGKSGGGSQSRQESTEEPSPAQMLQTKISRFSPTTITADVSRLSPADRQALDKIIEAARYMDLIYRRQVWSGNEALLEKLKSDASLEGQARLHYFRINVGPWSRLDKNEPFLDGVPSEKPPEANFYPADMTRQEFGEWLDGLSPQDRRRATGFFHAIRRDSGRKLVSVPYSQEYREFLEPAARLLREAAALTTNATLKQFLTSRAEAFLTDDYYASDVAWMELDAPIDVTIGPYETYEDELFSYKAAFEAFVTLRNDEESARLAGLSAHLQEIENNLPLDARFRNPKIGTIAPIRVVDVVFTSGEANRGVQTAAFNLPNDERIVKEKGTKRVMLKNVQQAKFEKTLVPIAGVVLDPSQRPDLSFEAFFMHILAHELVHGLGPHNISVGGRNTTVRQELKELYSAIEEAKADVTGLFALQHLIDSGVIDRKLERVMYVTFLASIFRSVRFGITEAHGRGVALQFNHFLDEGGVRPGAEAGTFQIDPDQIKSAVRKLAGEILTLQAEGSYSKADALLKRYAVIRPEMRQALDRLGQIPVDIEPIYPLAGAVGAAQTNPPVSRR